MIYLLLFQMFQTLADPYFASLANVECTTGKHHSFTDEYMVTFIGTDE
jgi:hypothetical protein